jgi:hypothetical protein
MVHDIARQLQNSSLAYSTFFPASKAEASPGENQSATGLCECLFAVLAFDTSLSSVGTLLLLFCS